MIMSYEAFKTRLTIATSITTTSRIKTHHLLADSLQFDDNNNIKVVDVSLFDLPRVSIMCNNQFLSSTSTLLDRLDLNRRIIGLFVPKLLNPASGGHEVIGLKDTSNTLVGMVDLSLQPMDGSLSALQPSTLLSRKKLHKNLEPYICNLLVSPEFRNKGYGSRLLQECERRVRDRSLGSYMNLHVELVEIAALKLYLKSGFVETRRIGRGGNDILFLRKKLL